MTLGYVHKGHDPFTLLLSLPRLLGLSNLPVMPSDIELVQVLCLQILCSLLSPISLICNLVLMGAFSEQEEMALSSSWNFCLREALKSIFQRIRTK